MSIYWNGHFRLLHKGMKAQKTCLGCAIPINGNNHRCPTCKVRHACRLRNAQRKATGAQLRKCSNCKRQHRSPGYCGARCKECHNENAKKYYLAYYKRHPERVIARVQRWAKNNQERVKTYQKQWFKTHRKKQRQYAKAGGIRAKAKVRSELIAAYGGKCACPKCPETRIEFLTVDHVKGSGRKHRKSLRLQPGYAFYCWLRNQGFPKNEYQLLCFNCNCAKRDKSDCPHVKPRDACSVTSSTESFRRAKAQAIVAYGSKCSCPGCPEKGLDFLTIDHINDDGRQHRRKNGSNLYSWLRRNGFPKDRFQLLCFNCNCAKWCYGICPHISSMSTAS